MWQASFKHMCVHIADEASRRIQKAQAGSHQLQPAGGAAASSPVVTPSPAAAKLRWAAAALSYPRPLASIVEDALVVMKLGHSLLGAPPGLLGAPPGRMPAVGGLAERPL